LLQVDEGGESETLVPAAAFDLEADGQLDLLTAPIGNDQVRYLLRRHKSALERSELWSVPYLDCPC
jgi:hypothetical protein